MLWFDSFYGRVAGERLPGRKPMVMDRAAVGQGWCRERAEHQGETSNFNSQTSKKIQIPSLRPAGGFVSFAGVGTGRIEPRMKTDLTERASGRYGGDWQEYDKMKTPLR